MTGFSNYDTANMPVEAFMSGLVHPLRRDYAASWNENLVLHKYFGYRVVDGIKLIKQILKKWIS
jgi:hypothetical protein